MPIQRIDSRKDPRISAYLSLKTRTERGEPLLIADGMRVLINLLRSEMTILSVLCEQRSLDDVRKALTNRPDLPIYEASAEVMEQIVGYSYHRGVMATFEKPQTARILDLGPRVVVLAGLEKGENIGAVLRNCAAFGVDSVVIGPGSATPFQRNAIRASCGYLFHLKIHQSMNLPETLGQLRERGYRVFATHQVKESKAYDDLHPGEAWALIIGNEGHGLPTDVQSAADQAVTIPMADAVDSLNVAAASAIILSRWYRLTR